MYLKFMADIPLWKRSENIRFPINIFRCYILNMQHNLLLHAVRVQVVRTAFTENSLTISVLLDLYESIKKKSKSRVRLVYKCTDQKVL